MSKSRTASKDKRPKFTDKQKAKILADADMFGATVAGKKHGISASAIYLWRKNGKTNKTQPGRAAAATLRRQATDRRPVKKQKAAGKSNGELLEGTPEYLLCCELRGIRSDFETSVSSALTGYFDSTASAAFNQNGKSR